MVDYKMDKIMISLDYNIKKIHHISDIHIRNLQRHYEYEQVFYELYKQIDKNSENSIIVITGDLFHNKTDLSPESVTMSTNFLSKLSDIAPTIVMLGNHDLNLNNSSRLDSVSPIINKLKIPKNRLIFTRNSKLIEIKTPNKTYGVSIYGISDKLTSYITAKDISDEYYKIALYHGIINQAKLNSGLILQSDRNRVDMFNGYDIVLLGDIHESQKLQSYFESSEIKLPEVWYAGSLIQQDYGESLNKGYLLWDIETKTPEFIKIPNQYGFVTIEVVENNIITPTVELPICTKVRIKSINSDAEIIESIKAEIHQKTTDSKVVIHSSDIHIGNELQTSSVGSLHSLYDREYRFGLIWDYMVNELGVNPEYKELAHKINADDSCLTLPDSNRNSVWYPKYMKFSNMFSYGKDNYINFETMEGIVGAFAPNASGKSSIIDILSFIIFDKTSRESMANKIMNSKCDDFYGEVVVNVDGEDYKICRTSERKRTSAPVKVDFFKLENGSEISLNGVDRNETNSKIREKLGTFEDFVITALSMQRDDSNFIDLKQQPRKVLLNKFLDLDIFDTLYKAVNDVKKEKSGAVKAYSVKNYKLEIEDREQKIQKCQVILSEMTDKQAQMKDVIETTNVAIQALRSKIHNVSSVTNIDRLLEKKTMLENEKTNINVKMQKLLEEISNIELQINNLKLESQQFIDNSSKIAEYSDLLRTEIVKTNELHSIEQNIQRISIQLDSIVEPKYNPECEYCLTFVSDTVNRRKMLQSELESNRKNVVSLKKQIATINERIESYKKYAMEEKKRSDINSQINTIQLELLEKNNQKLSLENDILKNNNNLTEVQSQITAYEQAKEMLLENEETNIKISTLQNNLKNVNQEFNIIQSSIMNKTVEIKTFESEITKLKDDFEYYKSLQIELNVYSAFVKALHPNGLPQKIVQGIIPEINLEVNNILNQITDFTLLMDFDDKNINIDINYGDERQWPVELASGFERFISSIAMRVALLKISSLPKPSFLMIDEGFGVLDQENLINMNELFTYLSGKFKFLFVISHLQYLKDFADIQIEIVKDNNFSKVIYE